MSIPVKKNKIVISGKRNPMILTFNLKDGSLLLNEGILDVLDWPAQIQIMFNSTAKKILLMPCMMNAKDAVVMPNERVEEFEISGRSLMKKIRNLVKWEGNDPRMCYGEYYPMHQAILFDLTKAEKLQPADGYMQDT